MWRGQRRLPIGHLRLRSFCTFCRGYSSPSDLPKPIPRQVEVTELPDFGRRPILADWIASQRVPVEGLRRPSVQPGRFGIDSPTPNEGPGLNGSPPAPDHQFQESTGTNGHHNNNSNSSSSSNGRTSSSPAGSELQGIVGEMRDAPAASERETSSSSSSRKSSSRNESSSITSLAAARTSDLTVEDPFRIPPRPVLTAALSRPDPLDQVQTERVPREALPIEGLRAPVELPESLQRAAREHYRKEAQQKDKESPKSKKKGPRQPIKLTLDMVDVLRQHTCNDIFRSFLEDLRKRLKINPRTEALWDHELGPLASFMKTGDIKKLLKQLLLTDWILKYGKRRQAAPAPNKKVRSRKTPEEQALVSEFRKFRHKSKESGILDSIDSIHEDVFIREFLDGHIPWARIRTLVGAEKMEKLAKDMIKSQETQQKKRS